MTDNKLTKYTFQIKTSDIGGGRDHMDPTYDKWQRRFIYDTEAEAFARHLSADRRNAWVKITRNGISWGVFNAIHYAST